MEQQQINLLQQQADILERQADTLREQAQEAKMTRIKKDNTMKEWIGYRFESSSGLTDEFALFARQFKRAISKKMTGYQPVDFTRGHFYLSGFFKHLKTGKFIYISISDVRAFPDEWHENLLVRTAKNEKDYRGGRNCFSTLNNIKETADRLIE